MLLHTFFFCLKDFLRCTLPCPAELQGVGSALSLLDSWEFGGMDTPCNFSRLTLLPRLWLQGKTLDSNTLKVKIKKLFKKIAAGLKLSLESWQLMGSNLDTSGWCQMECVCVCVSSDIWYTWSYFVVCCLEDLHQVGKEVEKTTLFVKCIS